MSAGNYHCSLRNNPEKRVSLICELFIFYLLLFCVCTGLYGVHFLSYLEKQRRFEGLWTLLTYKKSVSVI